MILELEAAWEERRLDLALASDELPALLGPDTVEAYRRLARDGRPTFADFRRTSIHALLDQTKHLLAPPVQVFAARLRPPVVIASPGSEIEVAGPAGPAKLRFDQARAATFWGIGFDFDDPAAGQRLASRLLRHTLQRLGSDLHGLHAIMRWLGRRHVVELPHIVPDIGGRRFEQLMLDILNELTRTAHRAPLFEDFLQKTDLRVHVPGLQRPRGARVQVTQTIHTAQHDEKLARIRNVNEFVILSPRSLALALGDEQGARLLVGPDRDHFWDCLASRPASVEELASALKAIFLDAIRRATDDPRGPAAAVPQPVRLLVQSFVVREAYRTTAELRRREVQQGRWPADSPKLHIIGRHGERSRD